MGNDLVYDGSNDNNEFKIIFDNLAVGLIVVDDKMMVENINEAALKLLCLDKDKEYCGKYFFRFLNFAGNKFKDTMQICLRTGRQIKFSFFVDFDNNPFKKKYIDATVGIATDNCRRLNYFITLVDTTEKHQMVLDSVQQEKMVTLGTLAAGVAHEFNNIWAAVHGYAELAKANDKFLKELVDVTLEQADRASDIIHSLLSFSDKCQEFKSGVKLSKILKVVLKLVSIELRKRNIEIDFNIESDPDVRGSEGQIQQIFLNLIINASHAIKNGGKIDVVLKEKHGFAVASFADNGIGMSEEKMSHIFDPFFTTKGAFGGDEKESGHGLGLTLTYNLVVAHRGKIDVKSKEGEGSCFAVSFPISTNNSVNENYTPVAEKVINKKTLNILVVDDEVLLQRLILTILKEHSVDVTTTCDEALALIEKNNYDVVLVDIIINGERDGFSLIDEMLQKFPNLPIVIITGMIKNEKLSSFEDKVERIIRKPFTALEIQEIADTFAEIK